MKTSCFKWISEKYNDLFAVDEIRLSKRLQFVFLASWFICLFDLEKRSIRISLGNQINCWAYFENCKSFFPFKGLPQSYDYMIWNGILLSFLFLAIGTAVQRRWNWAHFFLGLVLLWKFTFNFILVNHHQTNFELLHLIPSFVLLFCRKKLFTLKFTWAIAYLFAARVKLDEGWILGSYFTSLRLGLPMIPESLIPLATNAVIIGEMILSYGLISSSKGLRKISFFSWVTFHLYSTAIVGFYYPVRCLMFLMAIFAFPERDATSKQMESKRLSLRSWMAVAIIVFVNFLPSLVTKDPNISTEGLDYGFFMINANYQCLNSVTTLDPSGQVVKNWKSGNTAAMSRCFVFDTFQKIKRQCAQLPSGRKIAWSFLQSRNGGPFYEIINESDACQLSFNAFAENPWIKSPSDQLIRGYPEKNSTMTSHNLPEISPQPTEDHAISLLKDNYKFLLGFYKIVWAVIFILIILTAARFIDRYEWLKDKLRSWHDF